MFVKENDMKNQLRRNSNPDFFLNPTIDYYSYLKKNVAKVTDSMLLKITELESSLIYPCNGFLCLVSYWAELM